MTIHHAQQLPGQVICKMLLRVTLLLVLCTLCLAQGPKPYRNVDGSRSLRDRPVYPNPRLPFGNTTVLAVAINKFHMHVSALGNDSTLATRYRSVDGGDWSDWITLANPTCGGLWDADPVMGVNPDGTVEIFIRSALNLDLWQFYLTNPSDPTSWSVPREAACLAPPAPCWNRQDVFPTSDVSLVYAPGGRIQLYYRGFDGFLYLVEQVQPGNATLYKPPVSMEVILE